MSIINLLFILFLCSCSEYQNNKSDNLPQESDAHTPLPNSIILGPGDNIQAAVDANPDGAAFYLKAGYFRNQQVQPKSGNAFIGEEGAIMTGAVLLTEFTFEDPYYVVSNRTENGQTAGTCKSDYPRCIHPEDLFFDDVSLMHVGSLAQVVDNTSWYFDYSSNKIYFRRNPSGHKVELSSTRAAFGNANANDVIIRGLTIEKYAIPAQMAAIGDHSGAGSNWQIDYNVLRWNHGGGVNLGHNGRAYRNKIYENGGRGAGLIWDNNEEIIGALFEENEIYGHCIFGGIDCGWDGGGIKLTYGRDIILRNNKIHDNDGRGLWSDVFCHNILYDGNTVLDNSAPGINHELSYDAIIRNNIVKGNGHGFHTWGWGAQILVQNSKNVEVYQNKIVAEPGSDGLAVLNSTDREVNIENIYVHHNDITLLGHPYDDFDDDKTGVFCDSASEVAGRCANFRNGSVKLDYNQYHVPDMTKWYFSWILNGLTFSGYLAESGGQEINSTIDEDVLP